MSKEKELQYIYDLGFIYELGSNIGSYKSVRDKITNKNSSFINLREKIDKLFGENKINKNFIINSMISKYRDNYKDVYTDMEYSKLCEKSFFVGFLQGYSRTNVFLKSIKRGIKDLYYFQGNFVNPLGINSLIDDEYEFYNKLIDLFLNEKIDRKEYEEFIEKGSFIKADNIIGVLDSGGRLHLMITDNKIDITFLIKSMNKDNGIFEGLSYLSNTKKKKSQFSNINTDTSSLDFDFSSNLMKYASVSNDKNILKLIQCGSYAKSFLYFLEKRDKIKTFKDIHISLVGDTDTELSVVNLKYSDENAKKILISMRNAYKEYNRDLDQEEKMKIIKKGYRQLSRVLNKKNKKNKSAFNDLINLGKNELNVIMLSEVIEDHVCTTKDSPNMQEQHSEIMIEKFLNDDSKLICYLAGCPGIGKTYAFKKGTSSLKKQLTLYFSPRNAINDDFIQYFFDDKTGKLKYDDMIILNASSVDEKTEDGNVLRVVNHSINNKDNLPQDTKLHYKERYRERTFMEDTVKFGYDEGLGKIYEECNSSDGVMKKTSEAIKDSIYKSPNINKIIAYFTIQSLKKTANGNTSESLKNILSDVVTENTKMQKIRINPDKFDEFIELCPNLFIMIDEVTGSSEGAQLFNDIKEIFIDKFYDKLNEEQKNKLNLKIIVADASLPNKALMEKHLSPKSRIEQDKVYFASVKNQPPKNVYTEDKDDRTIVINANAYPASKLNIKYNIFNNSSEINKSKEENPEVERKNINKAIHKSTKAVNSAIVGNAINDIVVKKYPQTILFIQDKKRIDKLIETLSTRWKKIYDKVPVEGKDFVILNADLTEKQRSKYIKLIEDDAIIKLENICPPKERTEEYIKKLESASYIKENEIDIKFAFITSTASRGISFKTCRSMHILLQTSNVESYLTELSQAIYRPRGNWDFDAQFEKDINYYLTNNIIYQEDNDLSNEENLYSFEYRKNIALLNILSYITLLRGTVNTRIRGFDNIIDSMFSIVPVGGKYTTSMSNGILEQISGYRKLLSDAKITSKWMNDISNKDDCLETICKVNEILIKVFKDSVTSTPNTIVKGSNRVDAVYGEYMKAWFSGNLNKLLELDIFYDYKIINGMIVFKMGFAEDELELLSSLIGAREELLLELRKIMGFAHANSVLKLFTGRIIQLLEFELGKNKMQTLSYCESESCTNRYVAIPLHVFTSFEDVLQYDYSTQYSEEEDDVTINALESMKSSINQYTQCQSIFPIISDYSNDYPFITFKSDTLESMYNNKFNKDYVLSSTNTNIFNLIMLNK